MGHRRSRVTVLAVAALCLACERGFGDGFAYAATRDLRAETDVVIAEHHHDWGRGTEKARAKMMSTTKDPFTAENTYSHLRLVEKRTGRELFRNPVPALTKVWISPDSRYVVGLSNLKIDNPYQLVVFTRSGRRVLEKHISAGSWPGVLESVTNAVSWYKEPTPTIGLVEKQGEVTLSIEDFAGTPREFRFRAAE